MLFMAPLVSVLIPAYNAASYISETLCSAIDQTWRNREIIVVDDGSSDDTAAVVRSFANEGVRLIIGNKGGAAAARNTAFEQSKGDFIQWLDADDLLNTEKIAHQVRAILDSGSEMILASAPYGHFFYRTAKAQLKPNPLWRDLTPLEFVLTACKHCAWMGTPSWLMSRKLALAAGPWDTRLTMDDDGEYFCRVVLASHGVRFVPEAKALYRRRSNSLSSYADSSRVKMESQLLSLRLQVEHMLRFQDSERIKGAAIEYFQHFATCFYPERVDLFQQAQEIVANLGGRLEPPAVPAKYSMLYKAFGMRNGKRLRFQYNSIKYAALRGWDRMLHNIETRRSGTKLYGRCG